MLNDLLTKHSCEILAKIITLSKALAEKPSVFWKFSFMISVLDTRHSNCTKFRSLLHTLQLAFKLSLNFVLS